MVGVGLKEKKVACMGELWAGFRIEDLDSSLCLGGGTPPQLRDTYGESFYHLFLGVRELG